MPEQKPAPVDVEWTVEYRSDHNRFTNLTAAYVQHSPGGDMIEMKNSAHQIVLMAPKSEILSIRRASTTSQNGTGQDDSKGEWSVPLGRAFLALEALERGGDHAAADARIFLRSLTPQERAEVATLANALAAICRDGAE